MIFTSIIFLTALLMEAIGSYISVVGLSSLFAGNMVIMVMAVILDVAKVTSVSFLYKNWGEIKLAMKLYFLAAVIVLMTITSSGAFGYLSNAFQKAVQPNKELNLKLDASKSQVDSLQTELTQLADQRSKLDAQVAQLPANRVRDRQRLLASFKPDYDRIDARSKDDQAKLDQLKTAQLGLQTSDISNQVEIGPIAYIAQAFGVTMEQASKYIISVIISVFDPLAIMLILAGNFTLEKHRKLKVTTSPVVALAQVIEDRPPVEMELTSTAVPDEMVIAEPVEPPTVQPVVEITTTAQPDNVVVVSPTPVQTYPFKYPDPEGMKGVSFPTYSPLSPQYHTPALQVEEVRRSSLENPRLVGEVVEDVEAPIQVTEPLPAVTLDPEPIPDAVEEIPPAEDIIHEAIDSGEFIVDPAILSKIVLTDDPLLDIQPTSDISMQRAIYE